HIPALVCAIDALCAPGGQAVIADPGRDHLPLFTAAMQASGWEAALHPIGDIYVCRFTRRLPSAHAPLANRLASSAAEAASGE
ncbi:MAG TPA: hypothetical protein PL176_12895, partial [Kiritimatiellia bacterium]|nr:hypothetical protein [Kiritimatiellia bacterium]